MSNDRLQMKDLITEEHKHLLWKDECRDDFLILRHMEIFRQSKSEISIHCWSYNWTLRLKRRGLITRVLKTDDEFYTLCAKVSNLDAVMALAPAFKRRPHISGTWIRRLEKRLGHKIMVYQPELEEANGKEKDNEIFSQDSD